MVETGEVGLVGETDITDSDMDEFPHPQVACARNAHREFRRQVATLLLLMSDDGSHIFRDGRWRLRRNGIFQASGHLPGVEQRRS